MKRSHFIFCTLLSFLMFQACSDKNTQPDQLLSAEQSDAAFSKKATFVSPDESMILDLEFSSDSESVIQAADINSFIIKPIFEVPQQNSQQAVTIEEDDNEPLDETGPYIAVDIDKVKLPKGAIGYSISENNLSNRGWVSTIRISTTGSSCYQIVKTNSAGKTKYRCNVKYIPGQIFWDQIDRGTLKNNGQDDTACAYSMYKIEGRFNNRSGSTSILYLWDI